MSRARKSAEITADPSKIYSPDLHTATREQIFYTLVMFPYPSGYGLHIGHASNFTINDVVARYKRMQGYTVFNPSGYDSFGLPTENYAIKEGKPAYQVTEETIAYFNQQIAALNLMLDTERTVITSSPEYYKRTQRIFTQLYKAGLVYRDTLRVNRCPSCQTVLANDQVIDGACERCGTAIIQKKHPQRFIKITAYADRLISDLDLVDRPEETKIAQKNWIGKSEGAEIEFTLGDKKITIFTTRPDTIYGVTALMLAPENMALDSLLSTSDKTTVEEYRQKTLAKTAVQRQQDLKEKSGAFSGLYVDHPLTGEKLPVWYADYVLPDYGTGAVMFVPAHDERDYAFAKKFKIDMKQVIDHGVSEDTEPYTGEGKLINSGSFDGLSNEEAKRQIIAHMEKQGLGRSKTLYKLRDRSVSRQRYRGSPIPVYYEMPADTVPFYAYQDKERKHKEGEETLTRKVIQVIVKDKNSDDYAWIKRTHDGDVSGFFGGIEEGESVEDAIRRELREEGGFDDVELKKHIMEYHCKFYHPTKKRNQYSVCQAWYAEVDRGAMKKISKDEKKKHEVVWMSPEEFLNITKNETTRYVLNDLLQLSQEPRVSIEKYNEFNPLPEDKKIPHLIPEEELPVILPLDLKNYKPTGKSPLEDHPTFKYYVPQNSQVPFFKGGADDIEFDPTKPVVKRHFITAFIHDPKTDKYCFVERKNSFGIAPLGGGSDAGESIEVSAAREATEESGYVNLRHVKTLPDEVHSLFYAYHKNVNRYMIQRCVVFELIDDKKKPVKREAHENFDIVRLSLEEIKKTKFFGNHQYFLDLYLGLKTPQVPEFIDKYNEYNPMPICYRECDTLDTFMCSSFYFLRFPDANNPDQLGDPTLLNKCFPIDFYIGGKEHTVGHLLYSRFVHKFLYDQGYLSSPEPFQKLVHQGFVLGADGRKMSKRRGNVIDPIEVIQKYGSDAVKTYLMFMGPVEQEKVWNDKALAGIARFITRVEGVEKILGTEKNMIVERALHQAIKGVTDDIDKLKLNTAVSKLMILLNVIEEQKTLTPEQYSTFAQLLAPFAPLLAAKIWEKTSHVGDIMDAGWPTYDAKLLVDEIVTLVVQINGRVRANLEIAPDSDEATVLALAQENPNVAKHLEGGAIKKVIYVPGKILNIVI